MVHPEREAFFLAAFLLKKYCNDGITLTQTEVEEMNALTHIECHYDYEKNLTTYKYVGG